MALEISINPENLNDSASIHECLPKSIAPIDKTTIYNVEYSNRLLIRPKQAPIRRLTFMAETKKEKKSYLSQVVHFYFAPRIQSVFKMLYLIVFGYTLIYYFHNVLLAISFVWYTMHTSSVFQSLDHLFWGIGFVMTLIIPFTLSLSAIFILYRIWRERDEWAFDIKILITTLMIIGGIFMIIFMDVTSHIVAKQNALQSFIEDAGLNGRI